MKGALAHPPGPPPEWWRVWYPPGPDTLNGTSPGAALQRAWWEMIAFVAVAEGDWNAAFRAVEELRFWRRVVA